MKKSRMRHQSFFQAGAVWCVIIWDLCLCSARKNKACTVGFPVMLQLHVVVVGKRCSSCWQTPPPLLKQRLFSPCRLFNEAEPFQPVLPNRNPSIGLKTPSQSRASECFPCEFHHCWNLSVSNGFESVHPMGHPMSHSTHVGFRCPVGWSSSFT